MGRELDPLADVISFGVAPAAIAYACGMQGLIYRVSRPLLRRLELVALGEPIVPVADSLLGVLIL